MKKDTSKSKFKLPKLFSKKKNTQQNTGAPVAQHVTTPVRIQQTIVSPAQPVITPPGAEPDPQPDPQPATQPVTQPAARPVVRPLPKRPVVERETEEKGASSGGDVRPIGGQIVLAPARTPIKRVDPPKRQVRRPDQIIDPFVDNEVDEMLANLDDLIQRPPTRQVRLNVKGLDLVVDYSSVAKVPKGGEAAYIDAQVENLLGRPYPIGESFMAVVGRQNPEMAQWLMRALCFVYDNQATLLQLGVTPEALVRRLVNTARKQIRMSMTAPEHGFEIQILRVGGLMQQRLIIDLIPPDQDTRNLLRALYNPGKNPAKLIGPLRPALLRELMRPALVKVVVGEYRIWRTNSGNFTEAHTIEDIGVIADYVQGFLKARYGEYPLAAIESPYHNGWTYSNELVSTESKPGDDRELLGWLVNRGDYVGYGNAQSPYSRANYDPGRAEDRQVLLDIYHELLSEPKFRKYLAIVSQLTACHAKATGKVMVQPWYHNTDVTSRVNFRWKRARTLIHEFLHALTHKNVYDVSVGHKQILLEGFTEVITVEVFTQLIIEVRDNPNAHLIILGDEPYADPDPSYLKVGYGEAGTKAEQIAGAVSMDNIKAAYFLGETKLIGL